MYTRFSALLFIIIFTFFTASACMLNKKHAPLDQYADATTPVLSFIEIGKNSIHFATASNGCTSNNSFALDIVDHTHKTWRIVRIKKDLCRRATLQQRFSIQATYDTKQLKLNRLINDIQ